MNGREKDRLLCELQGKSDHDLLHWAATMLLDLVDSVGDLRGDFKAHQGYHRQIMMGALGLALTCVGALAFFLLTK